ncbi:acyl-CoA/acyl-ACP dehydrogenase [Ornithinimicrobium sp. F0845]|uniref:acyl-CoA dehydrogenase family protein n=1 Tax=Ornithinimicrobium sp. F0845 TaxID=2926412 RepID=UPI001FF32441|nr:acyl-CoA dehydrogenase family protein [Ornithinimicrobium sp. F0845]MCK0114165.1 acyl-CoA/acyl-ACP dehydrogenase [Ornithinimicrobium sp. F0845]
MSENMTEELRALAREVLGDHATSQQQAPGVERDLDPGLWHTLAELGLTRLTGREEHGGSGAGWPEAAVLLWEAAAHGVPVPLLEHDLLAGWLRDTAGLAHGEGAPTTGEPATEVPATEVPATGEPATGVLATGVLVSGGGPVTVPWLGPASTVVVLDARGAGPTAYEMPVGDLAITPARTIAGEPAGRAVLPAAAEVAGAVTVDAAVVREWEHRGALARAVQLAGAMDKVSWLCVGHAAGRTQFGRPLGRFQAVQQLVTEVACEAALCRAVVERAVQAVATDGFHDPHARFLVAAAKAATGHSVTRVVRHAHQVHGAIGTALEHPLQQYTRSLLAWRRDHGSTRHWEDRLETTALAETGGDLWDTLTR